MKDLLNILKKAFIEARKYLITEGYENNKIVRRNPSGDLTREFDLKAEQIIVNTIVKEVPNIGIISEESGVILENNNKNYFIIDPVDGSFNFLKKIGGAGCSIALLENSKEDLNSVTFGFVGNYITGDIFYASKGLGAFLNNKKIECTGITKISEAIAGVDFDFTISADRCKLFKFITQPYKIRYIGASTIDVCNVAKGAYDIYIDVRNELTPENFCATQLIIKEAGGEFFDNTGHEITSFSMLNRFNIIACSTKELKKEIIRLLI